VPTDPAGSFRRPHSSTGRTLVSSRRGPRVSGSLPPVETSGSRSPRIARQRAVGRRAAAGAVTIAVLTLAILLSPALPSSAQESGPRPVFSYADDRITESSGLASSAVHPGIVYTHNDNETAARIYAVDREGQTRAVYTLRGVTPRDWEGIAIGRSPSGAPAIFVGDIGDNFGGAWPEIWVYRFLEQDTLATKTLTATRFRFKYEDGPRNAEALLIDPRENRIYVVSKESQDAGIYIAPPMDELSEDKVNMLRRIAPAPPTITDGAFSPDGKRMVLRDYVFAHIYAEPDGDRLARITLPIQPQGEAVTFTRDAKSLLVGSEGVGSQVWQVPLPPSVLPQPSGSSSPKPTKETSADGTGEESPWAFGGNLLALAASGVALFGVYRVVAARRSKKR
jgi:hypothetical protein